MNSYEMLFKRRSFHLFKNTSPLSKQDLSALDQAIHSLRPLDASIHTKIEVVPSDQTTCKRGCEYCILFYSEHTDLYLRNIGYMGEQLDLYLAQQNIGTLWFGIGRPLQDDPKDMEYIIMMGISKVPADAFRKDMFKAKRRPVDEIWHGREMDLANVLRFAPSACNSQPWLAECDTDQITVYRSQIPGKRGIMPKDKVLYYNQIDIGIFLCFLEVLLDHQGTAYTSEQIVDEGTAQKALSAVYHLK